MTNSVIAIEVSGLTKYYGKLAAVNDLTLRIEQGEIYGFLGLNGAGKTTLLNILGGLDEPTSGKVVIDGIDLSTLWHQLFF